MTALTLYVTTTADGTLTNAASLVSVTGAAGSTTNSTPISTHSGWGELGWQANPAWASGAGPGTGDGYGAIWDVTTLEGQTFPAGTWTLNTKVKSSVGTETGSLELLIYAYNAGVYTQKATATLSSATYGTTGTQVAVTGSLAAISFVTGDKLYFELWFDSTSHTGTPTNILVTTSNSATQGFANAGELDTPGYAPSAGVLSVTLAGSGTLSETLSLSTAITTEVDGVGTLTGTLSLSSAITVEVDGAGTLTGSVSLSTALASTLTGAGTLTVSLTVTGNSPPPSSPPQPGHIRGRDRNRDRSN